MTEMLLTRREKSQLLAVLRELDPAGTLPPEMRRTKRRGVWQWMWVNVLPTDPAAKPRLHRILAKDVSKGGIGFYSRRPLPEGTRFVVALRFQEGGGKLFLCRTTFAQETSQHHHSIGAVFMESIEDPHGDARMPNAWLP